MLASLHISNYALIDSLDVDFSSGLSIITGETGAGKSIILGAIDLLRGRRADSSSLRDKSVKAVVEAEFNISDNDGVRGGLTLPYFFLPVEGVLTGRREISPTGRSRAFINDSPANLQSMQEITLMLLDIHSQHQTQQLANPRIRLSMIDSLAEDKAPLTRYVKAFEAYRNTFKRLEALKKNMELTEERRSKLEEQYAMLKELAPKPGEQKELEALYDLQSRANQLKEQMGNVRQALDGYSQSARSQIEESLSILRRMHIPALETKNDGSDEEPIIQRLESLLIELKDINAELEDMDGDIDDDPRQLMITEKRLDALYQAQMTFKEKDPERLPILLKELKEELDNTEDPAVMLPSLKLELKQCAVELKQAAIELTQQRTENARIFSEQLQEKARSLGLPNLKFEARIAPVKLYSSGADIV